MSLQLQPYSLTMKNMGTFGLLESVAVDITGENIHRCDADVTTSGVYIYPDAGLTNKVIEIFVLKNTGTEQITCAVTPASSVTEQTYHLAPGAILALADVSASAAIKLDTASTSTQSCQYIFTYMA